MTSSGTMVVQIANGDWTQYHGNAYSCEVRLREEAGKFVATAANMPTVTATGQTELAALESIRAELSRVIALHKQKTGMIPWTEANEPTADELVRTLLVTI